MFFHFLSYCCCQIVVVDLIAVTATAVVVVVFTVAAADVKTKYFLAHFAWEQTFHIDTHKTKLCTHDY